MRENGYYWIRLDDDKHDPKTEDSWEVAYYAKGEGFYSIWDGGCYKDDEVEQIDETRLVKKELM